jgi:hypothetical protein
VAGVDPGTGTGPEDNGDGVSTAVLAGAVVVAFLAGGAVSGAYFVARGRA